MAPVDDRVVNPSQEDSFVRGVSELFGGPVGEHARPPRDRLWTPARIVITLAILVFALHWIQKSPCQDGMWENSEQYTRFCYSDVLALYYEEHLNDYAGTDRAPVEHEAVRY